MIDPTEKDVADRRRVAYTASSGEVETGVVTSVNEAFVFVLYEGDHTPKPTRRQDLEWLLTG